MLGLGLAHEAKGEEEAAFALYEKKRQTQAENPAVCLRRRSATREARLRESAAAYGRLPAKALETRRYRPNWRRPGRHAGTMSPLSATMPGWPKKGTAGKRQSYHEMALCALALKNFEDMLRYAHEALLRDPADADPHRRLADHHYDLGEQSKAMPHYQAR